MKKKLLLWLTWLLAVLWAGSPAVAQQAGTGDYGFRLVSWNISGDSHITHMAAFQAMMRHMQPDILVLDEVLSTTTAAQLKAVLDGIDAQDERPWNVSYGPSGGRQRGTIASRWPLDPAVSFAGVIHYPEEPRETIAAQMSEQDHLWIRYSMAGGIPVHAAIVTTGARRLLVVSVDLQCCGGASDDWQEYRRQVEARVIRELTDRELGLRKVDGFIIAGDLNDVGTNFPVQILLGPNKAPEQRLSEVEIYHLDGETDWTWDGRGTPFPSGVLDHQLHGAMSLKTVGSYIFDTEDLDTQTLSELGLQSGSSTQLSRHRPLVVDYAWRE
jgi:endonuclease/exonuclease/phosphatase family metal-dependent hydrolase